MAIYRCKYRTGLMKARKGLKRCPSCGAAIDDNTLCRVIDSNPRSIVATKGIPQ